MTTDRRRLAGANDAREVSRDTGKRFAARKTRPVAPPKRDPDEFRWRQWRSKLDTWAQLWSKHRFAGVVQRIASQHKVLERLLHLEDGERLATISPRGAPNLTPWKRPLHPVELPRSPLGGSRGSSMG